MSLFQRIKRKSKRYGLKLYEFNMIKRSGLFDIEYYLTKNPDVRLANLNPIWHFVYYGCNEGRSPHPLFDTAYYLRNYPDVKESSMNPLIHYIKHGDFEGRRPHPMFDNNFYRLYYSDELKSNEVTLLHYLANSNKKHLRPHPLFNPKYFTLKIGEDIVLKISPLVYFLKTHCEDDQVISPIFDELNGNEVSELGSTNDIDIVRYVRHIYENEKLRKELCELFSSGDYEGMDYLYNRTLPVPYSIREITAKSIFRIQSLFKYACTHGEILYEQEANSWSTYLNSVQTAVEFSPPREYICRLKYVQIIGGTRLIIANNLLLHDEMAQFDHSKEFGVKLWNYARMISKDSIEIYNTKKRNNAYLKSAILISCDHDNNYFHWMVENLAKVELMIDKNMCLGIPIIISENINNNFKVALQKMVKDRYPIYEIEEGVLYNIEELVVPSDLSRIMDKYSESYILARDIVLSKDWVGRVRQCFAIDHNKNFRKVYLTRKQGTYRKLANEHLIELELLRRGFEIIELTGCSLDFQIELFSQVSIVIAPTGATVTNMLLSPADSKFIVLTSDHEWLPFNFWEQLASICNVKITNVKGNRLFTRDDFHDDYEIDVEELVKVIDRYCS